ncbi:unnamed protein product [Calypogeia fissa]
MFALMATFETVKIELPDAAGVAAVLLNRPSRANALNHEVFRELPLALRELDENPSTRVIILGATGEKHFCAGIDLELLSSISSDGIDDSETGRKEFGKERDIWRRNLKVLQDAITGVEKCRKPVIAAIHGACIGGGVDLITACDIRYCTEDATFSVIEVDLAITADLGTLQRLPLIIGYSNAMELALTARPFDGKEAKSLGLVKGVYPSKEELEKEVREIATRIAEKSPLAVMGTKAMLLKSRDVSVAEGLDWVVTWNAAHMWPSDVEEALRARMEKRKPIFAKL